MSKFDIEELIGELTLQEKIALIAAKDFWHTSPVERLGIPSVRVSDGPNGVRGTKFFNSVPSAAFPNGTGLASTFDTELLEEAGQLMAVEAAHKNASVILGPTTNIARGPLGGRGFESFSEDPYLSGMCTAALVNGMQSRGIAATVKHYVCNDLEDQRFSSNSIVTERALREIYLEPFRLAVKYANPVCIMSSYNKVNGTHCSQSKKLLDDILREEWGWDGMITSDWFGTYSSADAIKNGLDIEFPGPTKWRKSELISHLISSKEGISEEDVNTRVRNVLKMIKFAVDNKDKTGIIENGPESDVNNTPETAAKLRKIAADSIVLLKNENNVLPLSKDESIVVIGPNAKTKFMSGGGSASLNPYYVVPIYDGIKSKLGKDPEYSIGCTSNKTLNGLWEACVIDPSKGNQADNIGAQAIFYTKPVEDRSPDEKPIDSTTIKQSYVTLFDYKNPAVEESNPLFYVDFEGYYTPEEDGDYEIGLQVYGTALLFIDGELVVDNKTKQTKGTFCFSAGTIEEKAIVSMKAGKSYKFRVEYGSGPTSQTASDFGAGGMQVGIAKKIDENEEIAHAAQLAKEHDKVVLCIGLNGEWESEGYDRENMTLPKKTNDLVRAVLRANPNTVVVNQSGTPVEMPWISECNALLQCWYGGNELGNAVADIAFADVVPSAKLSLSWPFKNEDNPAYLNFATESGRVLYGEDVFVGYRFYEKLQRQVAFPFGYGLSYTTFTFENLEVTADESKEILSVQLDITNSGSKYAGAEVVQVYVAPTKSGITRPVKELKGFKKVYLEPNETKKVSLELPLKDSISYFEEYHNKWCAEAGEYQLLAGSSSDDTQLISSFELSKTFYWKGL